jgi:hypothetical protein
MSKIRPAVSVLFMDKNAQPKESRIGILAAEERNGVIWRNPAGRGTLHP